MKELELTIQDIQDLMAGMSRNRLSKLKLQQGGFSLELEGAVTVAAPAAVTQPAVPLGDSESASEPALPGNVVTSPIVGTFYASPAPDREPFVAVGSRVSKGDVLFIIESMKLMNEVLSEHDGTVTKIMVENAQGVEFGQPILCIE